MSPRTLEFIDWLTAMRSCSIEEVRYLHKSRCGNRNHDTRNDMDRCVARIFTRQERAIHHRFTHDPRVA